MNVTHPELVAALAKPGADKNPAQDELFQE